MRKLFFFAGAFLFFSCGENLDNESLIAEQSLRVAQLSEDISKDFLAMESLMQQFQTAVSYCYENQNDILTQVDASSYKLSDSGIMYKDSIADYEAALYVSGVVPITPAVKRAVYFTEALDSTIVRLVNSSPVIVQAYYNDANSLNRIYPPFDVLSQYEPKMDIPSYNFYYLADETNNPERKIVWVSEPYIDPAGRGWMVSCIGPVYHEDKMVGVPGLDLTVNAIVDKYLKAATDVIILDQTGTVVAASEKALNLFSLPPLINHRYSETIKSDSFRKDDFNLKNSKSREIRNVFDQMQDGQESGRFTENNKAYAYVMSKISLLGWYVVGVQELK